MQSLTQQMLQAGGKYPPLQPAASRPSEWRLCPAQWNQHILGVTRPALPRLPCYCRRHRSVGYFGSLEVSHLGTTAPDLIAIGSAVAATAPWGIPCATILDLPTAVGQLICGPSPAIGKQCMGSSLVVLPLILTWPSTDPGCFASCCQHYDNR